MASAAMKKTTGLTGLVVAKNPHYSLTVLYNKILATLRKIPETSAYRRSAETVVNGRFLLVQTESDARKLEEKIGGGQVEELIIQAENELFLARKMLQWRAWEPPTADPPRDQWKWPL